MIKTPKHLAYTLKVDLSEIESITKNINNFYREKCEVKKHKNGDPKLDKDGNPKIRKINPSQRRLKVIQKRIQKDILSKIEMPPFAFGAVKGKDNVLNAKKHQGKKYKFTTDLKDYFPSIKSSSVYKMFIENDFSPDVSKILTNLTTYQGQIPQGAPTSSTLANLVFINTGRKLYEFSERNNITFTSFVDDLSFSSPTDFKELVPEILDIITSEYKISHQKTHYSRNPNITGLHPMNNHLKLPTSFMDKLKNLSEKTEEQKNGLLRYKNRIIKINSERSKM